MSYTLGIILAITSGAVNNLGVLFQKKVINDHVEDPEFLKSLIKNPTWVFGLLLQLVIGGAILYMIAQVLIGPTLVPGLMSAGLIVLVIGSTRILKERLRWMELLGIFLMGIGIIIFSLSGLSIDMASYDILDQGFLIRLMIFTIIIVFSLLSIQLVSRHVLKGKGVVFAMESGLSYSLNSVWIAPLITFLTHLFSNAILFGELLLFLPALCVIILSTAFGIIFAQKAYQQGQANLLSPLIGVPGQVVPAITYFLVFKLSPPTILSVIYLVLGLLAIIISTLLLSSRQVKLEKLKI
ncbi:MAG: hypothetical protein ACTSU4_11745 [Promethearchaeota archaeon]